LTACERIENAQRYDLPDERYEGECAWEGDDYQAGLEECRRLNAERRRKKGEVKG